MFIFLPNSSDCYRKTKIVKDIKNKNIKSIKGVNHHPICSSEIDTLYLDPQYKEKTPPTDYEPNYFVTYYLRKDSEIFFFAVLNFQQNNNYHVKLDIYHRDTKSGETWYVREMPKENLSDCFIVMEKLHNEVKKDITKHLDKVNKVLPKFMERTNLKQVKKGSSDSNGSNDDENNKGNDKGSTKEKDVELKDNKEKLSREGYKGMLLLNDKDNDKVKENDKDKAKGNDNENVKENIVDKDNDKGDAKEIVKETLKENVIHNVKENVKDKKVEETDN